MVMGAWFGKGYMLEKRLVAIAPQSFTANGDDKGTVTIFNAALYRVKQKVVLTTTGQPNKELEVKRVLNRFVLLVGPITGNIDSREDISAFPTAAGAAIYANEQPRPKIPEQEIERHTYEEEPVVARRVIGVDELGTLYGRDNPMPVKEGVEWDTADIERDMDDDIVQVEYSKYGSLVETVDLSYNGEKSVIKVEKS